jgi:hypothetical protein
MERSFMSSFHLGLNQSAQNNQGPSKPLGLNVESRMKLNLSELSLSSTASKALMEYFGGFGGENDTPMVNLKDAPKAIQGPFVKALIDFRNNYSPSVQPGFGGTGQQIKNGLHTLFGYAPSVLPDEAVVYVNIPGGGGGVGVRFSTKELSMEFGVHLQTTK